MEFLADNWVASIIAVAIFVMALGFYLEHKRRKDLEALASSQGLAFLPDGPDRDLLDRTGLEFFNLGRRSSASNLIKAQSTAGPISFFDYSYTTGSGKQRNKRDFTLALIECPRAQVPAFELKPEAFIYKIGEMMGFKDIDLPAFPVFSEKYRLTAPDEAAARMFFTPQRAAWFERSHGLRVQGAPGFVLFLGSGGRLSVARWQMFMEEVKAFASEVLR